MSDDQKEIRRYYDFSYLLFPAKPVSSTELLNLSTLLGMPTMKNLIVKSAVNAFVLASDIEVEKLVPGSVKEYASSEANIDRVTSGMLKLNMQDIAIDVMRGFIEQPGANRIYGHLLDFEISMLHRGVKSEPVRIKT